MKREQTKLTSFMMPESMHKALQSQSDARQTPMAAIIRFAIEQLLEAWGEDVPDTIMWGGARYSPSKRNRD